MRYNITVYYNPANPVATVESEVLAALDEFKTSQKFGGIIYCHKLVEAVTAVNGVTTAKLIKLETCNSEDETFVEVDTLVYLHAGYFNFTEDSTLTLTSINDM
ncbi:MAG: hypothetical protein R3Y50_06095 [Rikenellaceae bacterium]